MICTRPNTSTSDAPSWLGEPCPDCGHTSLAHPGITNLTLDACLVCEVQAAVQLLSGDLDAYLERVRQLEAWRATQAQALADQAALMAELRTRIEQLEARP